MTLCLCGRVGGRPISWPLDRPLLSIGRSPRCAIQISDPTVSKDHAEIAWTDGGCTIRDLGSRNGTRVNGALAQGPVALKPGDEVTIGHVALRVALGGESPEPVHTRHTAHSPSVVIPARDILRRVSAGDDPLRVAEALAAAGRLLVRPGSIDETCQSFLEVVGQAIPSSRLVLMLRQDSAREPVVAAARPVYESSPPVLSQAIMDAVLNEGAAVLAVDAESDPRFRDRASIIAQSIHSLIAAPLLDGEKVLGLVYADSNDLAVTYEQRHLEVMTLLANMAAVKIANARLLEAEEHRARIAQELATARLIQRGILPVGQPKLQGCEGWAFLETCHEVGGDLYDLWQSPGGAVYILVGDVSGKGMGAALLMASVLASVRILYEDEPEPDELARRLNRMIHCSTDASHFVTAFVARLDPTTGQLRYVNAGHPRPFLVDAGVRELPASALPLGVSPASQYVSHSAELPEGGLLVVYTDGIPEAEREGSFFGTAPLRETLRDKASEPTEAIAHAILDGLGHFLRGRPPGDDATLVLLRRGSMRDVVGLEAA